MTKYEKIVNFFKKLLPKKPEMLYNKRKSKRKKRGNMRGLKKEDGKKRAFFC